MCFFSSFISSVIHLVACAYPSHVCVCLVIVFFVVFSVTFKIVVYFLSISIVVKKDCWNSFTFHTFTKIPFMAQHVVSLGEYSICTWEECITFIFVMECSINIVGISKTGRNRSSTLGGGDTSSCAHQDPGEKVMTS